MGFGRSRRARDEFAEYYDEDERELKSGVRTRQDRTPSMLIPLTVLALIFLLFLLAIMFVAGPVMLTKTLTELASPVGAVWLGLFLTFYVSVFKRATSPAIISLLLWLMVSLLGNSFVSKQLARQLEAPFEDQQLTNLQHFDIVILLGGGVVTGPNKDAQAGLSGDRVVQVARLFHMGKIDRIVCTGTHSVPPFKGELVQAQAAKRLLTQLKVPESAILQLDGTNTLEELQAVERWLASQPDATRWKIGIVTSAWHLPRAMRLATALGIEASPIAADYMYQPFRREPGIIVPTAENLMFSQRAIKEWLAGWLNR
ncbi:MAG TPA: YdcF family protein [Pirellulaceae bacterium]|nr:YdcF family protein [Pirellulaceae bacterium]HMP69291.1 YdcF family protein [Pirellulaceae bacterium]